MGECWVLVAGGEPEVRSLHRSEQEIDDFQEEDEVDFTLSREMQFYDKLAGFVSSRTVSQCRSHHQKMFDKFKYVSKIIELFKN